MNKLPARMALIVGGQVQGVGFRPFIWRIANECALGGFVRNTSAGVRIEIQGTRADIARFREKLRNETPPLAKITAIDEQEIPALKDCAGFEIETSQGHAGQNVLVSPDVGICRDCLDDIRNESNPRFQYPFTNCTNCGPRFSITSKIPYDRPYTSMACFTLCENCAAEYSNPANRRFHAQPIACAHCGPKIWYVDARDAKLGNTSATINNTDGALEKAARLILDGGILALRGLGGFQLVCDASNDRAVCELRARKRRPTKALAVMARNIEAVSLFCDLSPAHINLLAGLEKPITLCPKSNSPKLALAGEIAPDTGRIGVMLPYTPLHALLLDQLSCNAQSPVLVMTSANATDEPICLGNREAIHKLQGFADGWLLHDRDILVRVDDSVVMPLPVSCGDGNDKQPGNTLFIRRARGYVPRPIPLRDSSSSAILGTGAELKTTFCLTRGSEAFVSQHIGDMKSPANMEFYQQALAHMQSLLECAPAAIVRDLHPDYMSSIFAEELGKSRTIPIFTLQHHAAHAASVLAENACFEAALALCLDGSGLGVDGSIWGGELIFMDLKKPAWQRLGSLEPFPLPGGETAIREPWRVARGLLWDKGLKMPDYAAAVENNGSRAVDEMLRLNINCPMTSSCGRLFDAVAGFTGLCEKASYEGHAAILLEKHAQIWRDKNPGKMPPAIWEPVFSQAGAIIRLDSYSLFKSVARAWVDGIALPELAAAYHFGLARDLADMTAAAARRLGIKKVGLSGGVLQNAIMAEWLAMFLRQNGLEPLFHKNLPPGDGGLSLGQACWGHMLLARGAS